MMTIESPRFGRLTVSPEKIIDFPRGLPGFEDLHRFTLLHPKGETPKYFVLQSLDDAEIAFHITDPAPWGFSYQIKLSDEESDLLGEGDPGDFVVVVMLIKTEHGHLRANLKAPLVINVKTRRGLQHIFSTLDYQPSEDAT